MGMFDNFTLKTPIKCTCGKNHKDFQTKSLGNMGDEFKQGQKAQTFFWRGLTEEEKEKKEKMDKDYPGMYDTPLGKLCGCITLSDEVQHIILDGKYNCYTNCNRCDSWIEANAIIENGIFIEIEIVSIIKNK
jgi:hypothetical protein